MTSPLNPRPQPLRFIPKSASQSTSKPALAATQNPAHDLGFGSLIRRARIQSGLTHLALAERLEVPEHTLRLWEAPDYEGVSLAILRRVARATGQSLEVRFKAPRASSATAPAWKSLLAEAN